MSRIQLVLLVAALLCVAGSAEAVSVLVDFEGVDGVCGFADTAALRTLDAAPGVTFGAPGALDGGAILHRCAAFGVVPRSGDHYLAFNRGAAYADGGRPTDPQSLSFADGASRVSIWASGGNGLGTSFLMEAFGTGGTPLGTDSATTAQGAWSQLEIVADAIRFIRLTETGGDNAFVFDDLSYDMVPEPATGLLLALGLAGLWWSGPPRRQVS